MLEREIEREHGQTLASRSPEGGRERERKRERERERVRKSAGVLYDCKGVGVLCALCLRERERGRERERERERVRKSAGVLYDCKGALGSAISNGKLLSLSMGAHTLFTGYCY
jgi:hypothetical protein